LKNTVNISKRYKSPIKISGSQVFLRDGRQPEAQKCLGLMWAWGYSPVRLWLIRRCFDYALYSPESGRNTHCKIK